MDVVELVVRAVCDAGLSFDDMDRLTDVVMGELIDTSAIFDVSVGADVSDGSLEVLMTLKVQPEESPEAAASRGIALVRAALHGEGLGTAGWPAGPVPDASPTGRDPIRSWEVEAVGA